MHFYASGVAKFEEKVIAISGESRISQTGAPTPQFGAKPIIWHDLCRKLHENERNGPERASLAIPPDPPMAM